MRVVVEVVVFENDASSNEKLYCDRIIKVLIHKTSCVEEVCDCKKIRCHFYLYVKTFPIHSLRFSRKHPYVMCLTLCVIVG